MTYVLEGSVPWHQGEAKMHSLMHVPQQENPTIPNLRPGGGFFVKSVPLIAIGTLDKNHRPWTTLLGGKPGFADEISSSLVAIQSTVARAYDPVVEALLGGKTNGEVVKFSGYGKVMSALPIDLETRRRVKLMGDMVVACVNPNSPDQSEHIGLAQLVFNVSGSLGNCPKYLNKKHITPAIPEPKLISDSPQLPPGAIELLGLADTLFLSTSNNAESMDTNIRGGPRGFVRVLSNEPSGAVLVYPEYSGNRLYQSLGNLLITPRAGYIFPDFESGNVLYATGVTEILVGQDAAALLPHSNLAVKVTLTAARYVENGLPFRGQFGDPSPYNPSSRYLTTEKVTPGTQMPEYRTDIVATYIKKEAITPTISRFRFRISDPKQAGKWLPGQYATLSFKDELDMGYSHMKDDDPTSINDDYIRTFTVSSDPGRGLADDEFEITVRKKGNATSHLFRTSDRSGMEVPLLGFGGDFRFENATNSDRIIPFIAGGIGITPVISLLHTIDIARFRLYWSISAKDVGLVSSIFGQFPNLPQSTVLFLTGLEGIEDNLGERERDTLKAVLDSGADIKRRRLTAQDLTLDGTEEWYLCGGLGLKNSVLSWLTGKRVIYEDFTY